MNHLHAFLGFHESQWITLEVDALQWEKKKKKKHHHNSIFSTNYVHGGPLLQAEGPSSPQYEILFTHEYLEPRAKAPVVLFSQYFIPSHVLCNRLPFWEQNRKQQLLIICMIHTLECNDISSPSELKPFNQQVARRIDRQRSSHIIPTAGLYGSQVDTT